MFTDKTKLSFEALFGSSDGCSVPGRQRQQWRYCITVVFIVFLCCIWSWRSSVCCW